MSKRKKKARARKGHAKGRLRKRYGRSTGGTGTLRMNVTGQLVLDPETLETVIEKAVEQAVDDTVMESVADGVAETVAEAVPNAIEAGGGGFGGSDYQYGD